MNSSLDTDCVGIGDGKAEVSAGNNCLISSSLNKPMMTSFNRQRVSWQWEPGDKTATEQRPDRFSLISWA
jgi:hypothetical protein